MEFQENPSNRSRFDPCGQRDRQTDRHDDAHNRFSQLANMPSDFTLWQCWHTNFQTLFSVRTICSFSFFSEIYEIK